MRTASEMYEYCVSNGFGKGYNEKTALQHFQVVEKNLLANEQVRHCFIGILNFLSMTKHDQNAAVVVTDKRVIYGQRLLFNRENSKSIGLANISDVTRSSTPLFTIITIDSIKDKFNIALSRDFGDKAYQVLVGSLDTKTEPTNAPDVSDQLRKLKGLLDDGILTQDEFDRKKALLLGL